MYIISKYYIIERGKRNYLTLACYEASAGILLASKSNSSFVCASSFSNLSNSSCCCFLTVCLCCKIKWNLSLKYLHLVSITSILFGIGSKSTILAGSYCLFLTREVDEGCLIGSFFIVNALLIDWSALSNLCRSKTWFFSSLIDLNVRLM